MILLSNKSSSLPLPPRTTPLSRTPAATSCTRTMLLALSSRKTPSTSCPSRRPAPGWTCPNPARASPRPSPSPRPRTPSLASGRRRPRSPPRRSHAWDSERAVLFCFILFILPTKKGGCGHSQERRVGNGSNGCTVNTLDCIFFTPWTWTLDTMEEAAESRG